MKERTIRDCGGKPSRFTIDDFRFTIYFSVISVFSVAVGIDYLRFTIDYCPCSFDRAQDRFRRDDNIIALRKSEIHPS